MKKQVKTTPKSTTLNVQVSPWHLWLAAKSILQERHQAALAKGGVKSSKVQSIEVDMPPAVLRGCRKLARQLRIPVQTVIDDVCNSALRIHLPTVLAGKVGAK